MELAAIVPMPSILSNCFLGAEKIAAALPKVSSKAFALTSPMFGVKVSAIR